MSHVLAKDLREAVLNSALNGGLTTTINTDKNVWENGIENIESDEYDVPDTWKLTTIGSITNIKNGFTPKRTVAEYWNSKDIPWFTVDDIHNQGHEIKETVQHISNKALGKNSTRIIKPNTVLLCCTSATIGNYAITRLPVTTNQQWNGLEVKEEYSEEIISEFILIWAMTLKNKMISVAGSTTFPFLSTKKLASFPIPLPPIEEQARIIARVDELMAKIDEYEKLENELVELKKNFPVDMKAAVLQAAMQGKLTEQNRDDLSIFSCLKEDSIEFETEDGEHDIPGNWVLCNILNLCSMKQWKTIPTAELLTEGYPVYGANGVIGFYSDYNHEEPTLLITCRGATCGMTNITKGKCWVNGNALAVDKLNRNVDVMFLKYYIDSVDMKKENIITGSAQPQITQANISKLSISLPPIEEQRRIVEKLDSILPLCEELEKEIA